ncbi:MAG: hypothetical protein OHK0031_11310 [Anaerolineales bacterium]
MKFLKAHYLLFLALVLAGLLSFRDYGQSWDEPLFYNYAAAIPSAYQPANWLNVPVSAYGSSAEDHKYYGPAYLLMARPIQQALAALFSLEEGDAWHLVNFIGFLLALAFFRSLAKRTLPPNLASAATAFFALQPLFWGHAFINPKDIPFMAAFLAAMLFGLRWVDGMQSQNDESGYLLKKEGKRPEGLSGSTNFSRKPSGRCVIIPKILRRYESGMQAVRIHHSSFRIHHSSFRIHHSSFIIHHSAFTIPSWLPAAFALGVASAIRVIGPLAGILITLYLLMRMAERKTKNAEHKIFIIQYSAFIIFSVLVMFLLWPFLWQNPLARLLEVLAHMSDNPTELAVLFRGQIFRANEMPARYFPQMLALTLTLPTWPLALIGFWRMAARRAARREALLYALWFGLVSAYILLRGPAVYDGFRHFFFILPPIFIFAGHGLAEINDRIQNAKFRLNAAPILPSLFIFLLLLPGLLGILRLHPYEYTYYNALTGGTGGAYRAYETDYWLTCYREALAWARENQPEIPVYVQREMHLAQVYGSGLTLLPLGVETPQSLPSGARLLFSTRADLDIRSVFRNFPVEKAFGRDGADFCLLKRKQ